MRAGLFLFVSCILLSSCGDSGQDGGGQNNVPKSDLERAAIESGAIPDLSKISLSGRYEARTQIGMDKFCAVGDGSDYEIGLFASFGPTTKCEAQGSATMSGETLQIDLEGEGACSFSARFDGVEISFPGILPDGCSAYCGSDASLAGISIPLVEDGNAAAKLVEGRDIERLCS